MSFSSALQNDWDSTFKGNRSPLNQTKKTQQDINESFLFSIPNIAESPFHKTGSVSNGLRKLFNNIVVKNKLSFILDFLKEYLC